jgi:NADPH-dependent 2,4-dienoyl-CoA reductase/sulfur reductase-like enzyme
MTHYKYLIVGGGMTGDAAINGIRQVDSDGSIGLVGQEPHRPYNRPPLSKSLWKGKPLRIIWRQDRDRGVAYHLGVTATGLDPVRKELRDDRGGVYGFDKLLLATGGTPRRLPLETDGVLYFRTLDDYHRLRSMAAEGRHFVVVGGGFIGAEIAAALALNGKSVTMVFQGAGIGGRLFPRELGFFLNDYYRTKGVEVLPRHRVERIERRDADGAGHAHHGSAGRWAVTARNLATNARQELLCDGVVAGAGIVPNVDLARTAGLEIGNGVRVDTRLRTSHPDIYAAGDVAEFLDPTLGTWRRSEHEDNANTMGLAAGQSMAGRPVSYSHQPMFYSDLFELGYEAVGQLSPELEIVADWKEPYLEGVIYYLDEGRVRGVLLWNVWEQVDAARQLLAEPGPLRASDLHGRLSLPAHQESHAG